MAYPCGETRTLADPRRETAEMILYAESFAPWCERARWALDHNHVDYKVVEHTPIVDELALRFRSRRPFRRVSVPLLVAPGLRIMDSLEIARKFDGQSGRTTLFPSTHEDEVLRWNALSETLMGAGRSRVLSAGPEAIEALREIGPKVPPALFPLLDIALVTSTRYLRRKYRTEEASTKFTQSAISAVRLLTSQIADDRPYLVGGGLSFADIAMACALQFVLPVSDQHMRIGPHLRNQWTWPELLEESRMALQWRDRLYALHRRTRST